MSGDVSNYPDQAQADLATIMDGGVHFMDRMNAFMSAKDKAAAIVAAAEAEAKRMSEEGAKELAKALQSVNAARLEASKILQEASDHVMVAKKDADNALEAARRQAADIVSKANVDALDRMDEANKLMAEAKEAKSAVEQRHAMLGSHQSAAEQAKKSAEAALAEATSTKQKYEDLISRLQAAMSTEI